MTHPSPYILDRGHKYSLFFRIEDCGDVFYINFILTEVDTKDFEIIEHISWSEAAALRYITHCCGCFEEFTPKILQFDQEYDEEFVQKLLAEWLNERDNS